MSDLEKHMNEINYRKASKQEVPQIVELWKEFVDFHKQRDIFFTRSEEGPSNFGNYIIANLNNKDSFVYVAEFEKEILAYILCIVQFYPPAFILSKYGLISDLAVTSRYRRKGIGEKLFRLSKDWFSSMGITRIEVALAATNEVSTSFWRKMGLKPYKNLCFTEI